MPLGQSAGSGAQALTPQYRAVGGGHEVLGVVVVVVVVADVAWRRETG